jgi:four helix bundle protein
VSRVQGFEVSRVKTKTNMAEGYGRKTIPDYVRCLYIAYGSTCELETQTLFSRELRK